MMASVNITNRCIVPHSRRRNSLPASIFARSVPRAPRAFLVTASGLSLIAAGSNIPHPDKVLKGGEDAWFVHIDQNGGGQIYLADGVGGFNEQGIDPGLYARVLTYEAAKARAAHAMNPVASPNPKKLIQIAQENAKLPGASTMIIIELFRTQIRAANLGDSGFRVIRNGNVVFASPPQEHYFNCPFQLGYEPLSDDIDMAIDADEFEVPVQTGDLVIVGSDGLFDNMFDNDIELVVNDALAKVAGTGALSAARAVSDALAVEARKNAEDPLFESPFALEAIRENAVGTTTLAKRSGPLGAFNALATSIASAISGKRLGGKMDDITVVVGAVVATAAAKEDIAEAAHVSKQMQKEADIVRKRASGEEAKTLRSVNLRQEMDLALSQQIMREEAALKVEAAKPPEFSRASIEKMDAPTVRKLLEERGLPTSGKIERLRERLSQVKAK